MNAIDFLIQEHEHLRHSLMNISNDSHQENKREKFDILSQELIRHEEMEHNIWYPLFQNKIPNTVKHLLSEEKHAEQAIEQLNEASREAWEGKFAKFRKEVERHAKEEENDLFPEVRKLLTEADLEQAGVKLFQFKKDHPIS